MNQEHPYLTKNVMFIPSKVKRLSNVSDQTELSNEKSPQE